MGFGRSNEQARALVEKAAVMQRNGKPGAKQVMAQALDEAVKGGMSRADAEALKRAIGA